MLHTMHRSDKTELKTVQRAIYRSKVMSELWCDTHEPFVAATAGEDTAHAVVYNLVEDIIVLKERIALLEREKALLIKDLRETWDYRDEHIAEVLAGEQDNE
jgi:hypothetical protein